MSDINSAYTLDDIRKANAIIEMKQDAQRERDREARKKGGKH